MAPMTRSASPGGVPGENVAAYYRRRAAGGVGLIITEGVFIPHDAAGGQSNVPRLAGADSLAGWSAVTDAVHGEGSVIAAQLWHQGVERGVDPEFNPGVESVSPSGLAGDASPRGRALQTGELAPLAGQYAEAARNAKAAGFDAVELHGAHGYLLDQFLWERTNVRADGYGELSLAGWTKRLTGLPAVAVGSVGLQTEFKPSEVRDIEPAPVEAVLRQFADNEFDVIAVGRALLSDPEWVNKLRSGRQGEFVGFNIGKALSALY